ncbi:hypothetical protein [uncultured Fluviicola sp.]|uniref:hypothetical protein n=1 Tax=uncultured Fluviicola sp. TaxID=463303 RepID=UPI0026009698|nr:hypothetical protein [uncultured Fluviicola sp.]
MWLAIGATIIWAWLSGNIYGFDEVSRKSLDVKERQQLLIITIIFLSFWAYYFIRVGRTFLWIMYGREYIKVDKISMTIKTSIGTYGKAKEYYLENIKKVRVSVPKANSFQAAWENSPWIRGGERIEFDYLGKTIRFGRKLNPQDSKLLFQLLTKRLEDQLKKKK